MTPNTVRGELAQSVGYMSLFTSLAGAVIVSFVVWQLAEPAQGYIGDNAQLGIVQQSHQWTETLLDMLPVILALIAIFGSIAFVVYQTRFT